MRWPWTRSEEPIPDKVEAALVVSRELQSWVISLSLVFWADLEKAAALLALLCK